MILPLLISLIAPNLVQAKHFLVETEDNKDKDNKENLDAEDRLKDLLTEKQVRAVIRDRVIRAIRTPQNAKAIRKKLHQAYGDDENAVRLTLLVL